MSDIRRFSVLVRFTVLLLSVFCLIGCSKSPTAKVSGTVTYKGSPLTAGVVTFYGEGNKVATCSIEPNGAYTVANAPIGPAKIAVSVPPVVPEPKNYKIPQTGEKALQIPHNYADGEKSGLTYTVVEGSQEHPIELK